MYDINKKYFHVYDSWAVIRCELIKKWEKILKKNDNINNESLY